MADKVKFELLLKVKETDVGKGKDIIQVVKWGSGKATLEKRGYYTKDDELLPGKAKGFNAEDFKSIHENKKEIYKVLKSS